MGFRIQGLGCRIGVWHLREFGVAAGLQNGIVRVQGLGALGLRVIRFSSGIRVHFACWALGGEG